MKIQDFQDNVTCGGFDNIFANIYKPQDMAVSLQEQLT